MLERVSSRFGRPWRLLWRWILGLELGICAAVLAAFISASFALVLLALEAVGLLVVGIIRLVLVYRAAKVFRSLTASAAEETNRLENSAGAGGNR